jgi:hypothetical protein
MNRYLLIESVASRYKTEHPDVDAWMRAHGKAAVATKKTPENKKINSTHISDTKKKRAAS